MNVTNLEQVTFGVTDVETCRKFWRDFGLTEAHQPAGSVFSCRDRSAVVVRRSDDPEATAPDRDRLDAPRIDVRRPRRARPRGDRRRAREGSRRDRRCGWNVARDRSARVSDRVSRLAADTRPRPRAQVQHAGPSGPDQHARAVLQGSASARDDSYGVHDRRRRQDRAVLHRALRLHRKRLLSRPRLLLARRRVESSSRPVLDQRRQDGAASITSRSSSSSIHELFGGGLNMTRARLAHGARPRPSPDLVVLFLVLPQSVRRRGRIRLRLRRRRRELEARIVRADARVVRRVVSRRRHGRFALYKGIQTADTIKRKS